MAPITIIFLLVGYCWADEGEILINEQKCGLIVQESYVPTETPKILSEVISFNNHVFESDVLVDKSPFVKEIVEDIHYKTWVISCPRQWGKTLNLYMLKEFLEVHVDETGHKIPVNNTPAYSLFVKGEVVEDGKTKKLKSPLLISQYKEFVGKYLGTTPVILLDLSRVFTHKSTKQVGLSVTKMFNDHKYLLRDLEVSINSSNTPPEVKERSKERYKLFNQYLNMDPKLTEEQLSKSLQFLSGLLHAHFSKKVVILIDKFHVPWEDVFYSPVLSGKYKGKFFKFYNEFMDKTITTNPHAKKGVLAGVPLMPHEIYDQALFLARGCNMITGHLIKYFGFNQDEVDALFDLVKLPKESRQEAREWYEGYRANNTDLHIYNALSVTEFLTKKKLLRYWVKSGRSDLAKNLLDIDSFRERFRVLLEGGNIIIKVERLHFTWEELEKLYRLRYGKNTVKYEDSFADKGFMELFIQGYLTQAQNTTNKFVEEFCLRFATSEISGSMKWDLQLYYLGKFGIHYTLKDEIKSEFDKFIHNDDTTSTELKNTLTNFLNSTKLTNGTSNDRVLRMMMCYLAIDVNATERATLEVESTKSPDVLLVFPNRAIAINVRCDKPSAQAIVDEVKNLKIHEGKHIPLVKFIGINVSNNTISIDISAEMKHL